MSDFIYDELWMEILKRLPIKSLLICASVCKSWYSLITSPAFLSLQFDYSVEKNKTYPLVCKKDSTDSDDKYILYNHNNDAFTEYQSLNFPFDEVSDDMEIVGSCNGLICVSDWNNNNIHLWNPAIRKFRTILSGRRSTMVGFGFDFKRKDYKVVRVVYDHMRMTYPKKVLQPKINVYEFSTRAWKGISLKDLAFNIYSFGRPLYMNGVLHWFANIPGNDGNDKLLIALFDLGDESLKELRVPDCLSNERFIDFSLKLCGQSIALVKYHLSVDWIWDHLVYDSCDIWVLKEYGVAESWSKYYSVDMQHSLVSSIVLNLWMNGEILFRMDNDEMATYNPETKKFVYLGVHGAKQVEIYMESLVLLK